MNRSGPMAPMLWLAALALLAAALVLGPTFLLLSLEEVQTADEIRRGHLITAVTPWVVLAMAVAGAWLYSRVWRRGGTLARTVAVVPLLVLVGATFFSRERLVEWMMFAPIETIRFVSAQEATHVADDDLVMGIVVDGEARAYPVLMMAYHHIANDRLAGEPYVVTY